MQDIQVKNLAFINVFKQTQFVFIIGKNCEEDINECESSPCKNSGICLQKSNSTLYHPNVIPGFNLSLPEVFARPFDYANAAGYY